MFSSDAVSFLDGDSWGAEANVSEPLLTGPSPSDLGVGAFTEFNAALRPLGFLRFRLESL